MIRASDAIGLKVVTIDGGKEVETVDDILYSRSDHTVKGLLVKPKGMFSDAQVILLSNIHSIGDDAVMVDREDVITNAHDAGKRIAALATSNQYVTRTKILTHTGTELGTITDLIFDFPSGTVDYFEISQGTMSDMKTGRKRITADDILSIGEDATVVRGYTEVKMEAQTGERSIDAIVTRTQSTVREKGPQAVEKAKSTLQQAGHKLQQSYEKIKNSPEVTEANETLKQQASVLKNKTEDSIQNANKAASEGVRTTKSPIDENSADYSLPPGTTVKPPGGTEFITTKKTKLKKAA